MGPLKSEVLALVWRFLSDLFFTVVQYRTVYIIDADSRRERHQTLSGETAGK